MRKLALVAALASCAPTLVSSSSAILADEVSTAHFGGWGSWHGPIREHNPILGPKPSMPLLAAYTLVVLSLNTFVWAVLPSPAKEIYGAGVTIVEGSIALHNEGLVWRYGN